MHGALRAPGPWLKGLGLERERLQQRPSTFGVLAYICSMEMDAQANIWAQPRKALEATRPVF